MEFTPTKAIQILTTVEHSETYDDKLQVAEVKTTTKAVYTELLFIPQQFVSGRYAELIKRAFNNRTRERNYYRLYSSLLEGDITEEEFDAEIENNETLYVIDTPKSASKEDIYFSVCVSRGWMDVDSTDEFSSLFELDTDSIESYAKLLKE